MRPSVLVTGAAGFIGYHLTQRLLRDGHAVVGIDNLNTYYDADLKHHRLEKLRSGQGFSFHEIDLVDRPALTGLFDAVRPEIVVNLAAQAGVRYSIDNPETYVQSNLVGFHTLLEACRHFQPRHLLYASSSSVYGASRDVPFVEDQPTDSPVSMYAATKKANEVLAHSYASLFGIPTTGMRFFTVYGPLGRPDMAYYKFTNDHFAGRPIRLFNAGDTEHDLLRDFTFIDDVVEGLTRLFSLAPNTATPHRVLNIGNSAPVPLMQFVSDLEAALTRATGATVSFEKQFVELQPGDVPSTYASTDRLEKLTGYRPNTALRDGLQRFAQWYVEYHDQMVH